MRNHETGNHVVLLVPRDTWRRHRSDTTLRDTIERDTGLSVSDTYLAVTMSDRQSETSADDSL